MKVLFLYPNMQLMMVIPASITTLSAYLKERGVETDLFDTTYYKITEKSSDEARVDVCQVKPVNFADVGVAYKTTDMVEDFYKKVDEYKPDILAISANDFTVPISNKLIKGFKIKYPNIHVIMGGIFSTMFPNKAISNLDVDSICIGDGFKPLYTLVKRLETGESITNIPNLWVKVLRGVFMNPIGKPIDIDDIPYDDFDIFDKKRFYRPMGGKLLKILPFFIDIGCPYNCAYCVAPTLRNMYKEAGHNYLRVKSVDHIINELKFQVEKHKPDYLYCSTENFFSRPKEHIKELAERYHNEIGLPFWCESRVETITDENIKLLKYMGCDRISIGLESGNEQYRINTLKKTFTNDQFYDAMEVLNDNRLNVTINNMIGHMDETRAMLFDTIKVNRNAVNFWENINITLTVSTFIPCGGSGLQQECIDKGYFNLYDYLNNPPSTFHGGYFLRNLYVTEIELKGLYRTFPLYVRLPKERYKDIKRAEKFDEEGNKMFEKLKDEYWSIVK